MFNKYSESHRTPRTGMRTVSIDHLRDMYSTLTRLSLYDVRSSSDPWKSLATIVL
jgi:hypothetical protein